MARRSSIRLQVDPLKKGRKPAWGKPWRKRKKSKALGVLTHRGASGSRTGAGTRELSVKVGVERNIGASRPRQFCAWAYIPKHGRARKGRFATRGLRAGDRACASTPTLAVKRALRLLTRKNWT